LAPDLARTILLHFRQNEALYHLTDLYAGTVLSDPLRQSEAINRPRHFNVAENDVHNRLLVHKYFHSFIGVGCLNNFVSAVPQVLRNRHPHQNIVLNNEDCLLRLLLLGHAMKTTVADMAFLNLTKS
jgi:hypothetical protein